MERWSLYHTAPRAVEVVREEVSPPGKGEVTVRSALSAISAGTEMLFYRGLVDEGTPLDETIDELRGGLQYPYKYGYATVGYVERVGEGVATSWIGKEVFCFHVHESHFNVPLTDIVPIPPEVRLEDAVMFPGMETAASLVMDANPILGENVAVLGQGAIGLLTTAILARMPLGRLITADMYPLRRDMSLRMGAEMSMDPARGPEWLLTEIGLSRTKFDVVIELSGVPAGLELATGIAGLEGRIVVGSWYGSRPQGCRLGDDFHRQRLHIQSSQVSRIGSCISVRWSKERRGELVWKLVRLIGPSQLITHRFPIEEAPAAFRVLDQKGHLALQVVLTYAEG